MDLQSRVRWEDYTQAKEKTLLRTDTTHAPWFIVEGNDKRRARLNCISHLLERLPSDPLEQVPISLPRREFKTEYDRTDVSHFLVPSVY
jgi:hypothetical protein